MTPPKFSIITVVFNNEATIADTVRSVSMQTYSNVEYLIIDGQSTDGTLERIKDSGGTVTNLISEPDGGIYDAMNKGIALASGEFIGFINADDFYPSATVLSKVAEAFEKSGADSCYGDLCYVRQAEPTRIVRYWRSKEFMSGAFEKGWCPPHPTFFVRRSVYERLGGFDLSFKIAADVELMARYLAASRISTHYISEVLVKMRLGGTTNRSLSNIFKQNVEIRRALFKNGLHSSLVSFVLNKLVTRAIQFVSRPS